MKAYLITTGIIFGAITFAHGARIFAEWPVPAKDPMFILLTLLSIGLCVWALRLFASSARR